MDDQIPEPGDLVRRYWVTNAQKRRWSALSSGGADPDAVGLVIEHVRIQDPSGGFGKWVRVLWPDSTVECHSARAAAHRLVVVSKGSKESG